MKREIPDFVISQLVTNSPKENIKEDVLSFLCFELLSSFGSLLSILYYPTATDNTRLHVLLRLVSLDFQSFPTHFFQGLQSLGVEESRDFLSRIDGLSKYFSKNEQFVQSLEKSPVIMSLRAKVSLANDEEPQMIFAKDGALLRSLCEPIVWENAG